MNADRLELGRVIWQQATGLRSQVRTNLTARKFANDDVLGAAYNDLAQMAAALFPDDPILAEQLVLMPDQTLSMAMQFSPGRFPSDLASNRLEMHMTRLINRLDVVLPRDGSQPAGKPAAEVLKQERSEELRLILDALNELRRKQPELPPVDVRGFDFVRC